jgi:hypothetical protein
MYAVVLYGRNLATLYQRELHFLPIHNEEQKDVMTSSGLLLIKHWCVGFEVFTAVVLKSIFFWDMTPCSASGTTQRTTRRHILEEDTLQALVSSSFYSVRICHFQNLFLSGTNLVECNFVMIL